MAIERDPRILEEGLEMAKMRLPSPIGLAGLTSVMARAEQQEKDIAALDRRYINVQSDIDDAIEAHKDHVGDLEHYRDAWKRKIDGMVAKPNGGAPLDGGEKTGQPGQSSVGQGQTISSDTPKEPPAAAPGAGEQVVVTPGDVGNVEQVLAPGAGEVVSPTPPSANGAS